MAILRIPKFAMIKKIPNFQSPFFSHIYKAHLSSLSYPVGGTDFWRKPQPPAPHPGLCRPYKLISYHKKKIIEVVMGLMCNKIVSHCPIDESHLNFSGRIYCIQFFLSARNQSLLWVRFFSRSTKVRLLQSWHRFLEPPRQLRVRPLQKALFDHFNNSMMGRTQERSRILNWTNLEYQPYDLSELEEPFDWRSWD